jgi:hypothetical protein
MLAKAQAFKTARGATKAMAKMRDITVSESHHITNLLFGLDSLDSIMHENE